MRTAPEPAHQLLLGPQGEACDCELWDSQMIGLRIDRFVSFWTFYTDNPEWVDTDVKRKAFVQCFLGDQKGLVNAGGVACAAFLSGLSLCILCCTIIFLVTSDNP